MEPIKLTSNEFWGGRSGMTLLDGTFAFWNERRHFKRAEHGGPCGYKLRKGPRHYRNAKFVRRGIALGWYNTKGRRSLSGAA